MSLLLRNFFLFAKGGIIVLVILLTINLWRTGSRFGQGIISLFSGVQSETSIDPRSLVIQQVRGASELTTAVYAMESVVPTSRERTWGDYVIGKTTLLYIAYGEVRAGVDLSALQESDIDIVGEQIQILLPPPEILDSKIDVTRSKVYDYDRGFLGLGPDSAPELQDLAQRETLDRILAAACDNGILEQANERAETVVTRFLLTSGHRDFLVKTQPPTPEACTSEATISAAQSQ